MIDKELLVLSGAAIVGIAASAYFGGFIATTFPSLAVGGLIGGVALLAAAFFVFKDNAGYMGPLRVVLGVAGLVLALRGVLVTTGLEATVSPMFMGVI